MKFMIKSKSSGSIYTVGVSENDGNPVIKCSCPAGDRGQYCKHRFALIGGDDHEVIEATHDISDLVEFVRGTRLVETIYFMQTKEAEIREAQAGLKAIKKQIARMMHGET
jgi:hypothetical protein